MCKMLLRYAFSMCYIIGNLLHYQHFLHYKITRYYIISSYYITAILLHFQLIHTCPHPPNRDRTPDYAPHQHLLKHKLLHTKLKDTFTHTQHTQNIKNTCSFYDKD